MDVLQEYELKLYLVDPAAVSPKPVTVATAELNMALFASAPGVKRPETVFLALKENAMWNVLHGDVLLRVAVVCLEEVSWEGTRGIPATDIL